MSYFQNHHTASSRQGATFVGGRRDGGILPGGNAGGAEFAANGRASGKMGTTTMLVQCNCFDDVDVHANSVIGWQQTYDQLGAGHAHTTLKHLTAERFQIFRETFDKRIVQIGAAPAGRLCLAMPVCSSEPSVFQGKPLTGESVTVLHGGQEFFVQSPGGIDLLCVAVDISSLETFACREFSSADLCQLSRITRLDLEPAMIHRMRKHLERLIDSALVGEALSETELEEQVLEFMLVLLDSALEWSVGRSANSTVSTYLVKQSQELALANQDEPPSVLDLCKHLNVSRSTLQRSFLSVTGLRPVEYLRALRLNIARRRLRSTETEQLTVARVASDLGFSHLGHFSGAYRTLFGETPSQTPRAR